MARDPDDRRIDRAPRHVHRERFPFRFRCGGRLRKLVHRRFRDHRALLDFTYAWKAVRPLVLGCAGIVGIWFMRKKHGATARAIGLSAIAFFLNYLFLTIAPSRSTSPSSSTTNDRTTPIAWPI
jgi:hypothetical protein